MGQPFKCVDNLLKINVVQRQNLNVSIIGDLLMTFSLFLGGYIFRACREVELTWTA